MRVNKLVEYPTPDEDDPLCEELFPEQEWDENTLSSAPTSQKVVLFCLVSGQDRHLKWWLMKYYADHVDMFLMYAEMGYDEQTEMQFKIQDLRNPTVCLTTPKVHGTGLNLTAANHAVVTQKFWVLNEQRQAIAQVVRSGQNRVPYT